MDNLKLILDTGNFLFKNVLNSYKKSQKFKRGEKGGKASLKKFGPQPGFVPVWGGYNSEMLRNFMVECFTVAAVNNYDLQEKLKEVVNELTVNPEVKDIQGEFVKRAKNLIPQYNYTGEEPREGALRTNLRTAMTSAYHAGIWDKVKQAGIYRFLQYNTRMDDRVREEHQALEGKIYNIDDPVWQRIYPPNGWNCRCYTTPLTHDEMLGTGYPTESLSTENDVKQIVKQAGVSKEFMRNSGMTQSIWGKWLDSKLKGIDLDGKIKEVFRYSKSVGRFKEKEFMNVILTNNKAEFISGELTVEKWNKEFPDNKAKTPLGEASLKGTKEFETALKKMLEKSDKRYKFWKLIKPTLNEPALIIKDKRDGLVFLRMFEGRNRDIVFSTIGYHNGKLINFVTLHVKDIDGAVKKLEGGEILHFYKAVSDNRDFTKRPSAFLTVSERLKFDNNLIKSFGNYNEIWGTIKPGKVYSSVMYKIKYGVEGFFVNEGKRSISYDKLDDWRKGVIINCSV